MPSQGRRNVRAQLLMNYLTFAEQSAMKDDYLNAITFMRSAAQATGLKLPPRPYGIPDIVRGDAWKGHRAYFHLNFEKVAEHVNKVLQSYKRNSIGLWRDEQKEDDGDE